MLGSVRSLHYVPCLLRSVERKEKTTPCGAWIKGGAVRLGPKIVRALCTLMLVMMVRLLRCVPKIRLDADGMRMQRRIS